MPPLPPSSPAPDPASEIGQLQDRYARLSQLYQVSQVIHSTLEPQEALKLIVGEAVRLVGAGSGLVALLTPEGLFEIEASHGLPAGVVLSVAQGLVGWVVRTGRAARVGEAKRDPRCLPTRPEVRSELAVPLEVGGQVRGVLGVDSDQPNAFSQSDQELLESLASQAAQVIRHTWLYEQFRQKARLLETLVSVGQTINSMPSLDEALRSITREAALLMEARVCSLLLLDATGEWLDLKAHYGAGAAYLNRPRLSVQESLVGVVVRRRKPIQERNVQKSARYVHAEVARSEHLVSLLSVPLLYSGRAIGALNVYKGEPYAFSNEEVHILSTFAELSALALEKARLYERVVDLEEQMRQSERLSALGLLAAEVAHEIRNPLTVLKMLYHSLDLHYPAADPRARDAELMGEKLDHLNRIVERVLDFARRTEPHFARVDLNELLNDLALLTRHKLKTQNVELARQLAPGLPLLSADATQLEQAFLNLTLNAAEAMPAGGSLTITTLLLRRPRQGGRPSHVAIVFRDTGPGMTEEARRRALDGLLLNTTKQRGTGLGLAIVRRVVETHRGRLKIKSRVGQGTEISLVLPIDNEGGPAAPGAGSLSEWQESEGKRPGGGASSSSSAPGLH
jgi:signal transduction histidine kinase